MSEELTGSAHSQRSYMPLQTRSWGEGMTGSDYAQGEVIQAYPTTEDVVFIKHSECYSALLLCGIHAIRRRPYLCLYSFLVENYALHATFLAPR